MRFAVAVIVILGIGAPAQAENRAKAREAFQRGTQHYDLSEYEPALEAFKEAYRSFEEPTFLFNIAQCYRQLGDHQKALRFYRTYLIKVPAAPNRDEVKQLIAQLMRTIEEEKQRKAPPPPSTLAPATAQPEAPSTPAPLSGSVVTKPASAEMPTGAPVDRALARRKVIAGAVTAAFGVAAAGVGAACLGLAKSTADSLTSDDRANREFDPGKEQQGTTYQLLGGVFLGIGAAAAVVGVTIAVVGAREQRRGRTVALWPALSPQHAGAVLQVAF